MNHKLRVAVRVDVDPGHVTLLATGCLTRSNYPVLLHIMRRAQQLASGSSLQVDLTQSSHLDLEVLEYLRHMEGRETEATDRSDADDTLSTPHTFQLTLIEPAQLPVCLVHAGMDGERMAGLDGEILSGLGSDNMLSISEAAFGAVSGSSTVGHAKPASEGGVDLSFYLEGTLEPASTVAAMPDENLAELADALYRHLDTRKPLFGAHTWYDFAADELQRRQAEGPGAPSAWPQCELAMG